MLTPYLSMMLPEAIRLRVVGRALVHHRRRAVGEDSVDDVAVAGDPADVGRAQVGVVLLQIEDPATGGVRVHHVAAGRVHDALRLAGRAARVENEERVLGIERLGGADVAGSAHQVVPPVIAPAAHVDGVAGALHHHDRLHAGRFRQRRVDVLLQRHDPAAPVAAVGGDDDARLRVVHAVAQRLGAETAEDDAVRRADARAGQHGDGHLGDHRHVETDAVALGDAERLEDVGEARHLALQVGEGQHPAVARLALPDDRRLVAPRRLHVAIEAVVGEIGGRADEPLREGRFPVQHLRPRLEPVQLGGGLRPEGLRVGRGRGAQRLPLRRALDERLLAEFGTGRKDARLLEDRFDVLRRCHRSPLAAEFIQDLPPAPSLLKAGGVPKSSLET